jgi:DNA-binding cell septation regulator SpoVG
MINLSTTCERGSVANTQLQSLLNEFDAAVRYKPEDISAWLESRPTGRGHRTITVCDWKPLNRGGLRGFVTLTLASGLIIHNCQLIEAGGRAWVGLPSLRFSRSDGSIYYSPVLDFVTRTARRNFERSALEAVEAFLKARGEW